MAGDGVGKGRQREDEGFKNENSAYIKGGSSQPQHLLAAHGFSGCSRDIIEYNSPPTYIKWDCLKLPSQKLEI